MSYLEVFKGGSLKVTTKERFKISFSHAEQNVFPPARLRGGGLEAVTPHASPFIPSNPKAGQTTQEVSHIHLGVTPSQQEANLYNHIHPFLAIYEEEIHTVPKKFPRGKINRDGNSE